LHTDSMVTPWNRWELRGCPLNKPPNAEAVTEIPFFFLPSKEDYYKKIFVLQLFTAMFVLVTQSKELFSISKYGNSLKRTDHLEPNIYCKDAGM